MVGTLEAAADKHDERTSGQAGAYYHDIGKLKNPKYFVETR